MTGVFQICLDSRCLSHRRSMKTLGCLAVVWVLVHVMGACTNCHADVIDLICIRKVPFFIKHALSLINILIVLHPLWKRRCVMFAHAGDSVSHAQVTFSHACHRSLNASFHFLSFLCVMFPHASVVVVILCLTYRSHIWCS